MDTDHISEPFKISVAYRYRKSISIIELFVSIYIDIYRVLSNYFLAIFIEIYRVGDNRRTVNTDADDSADFWAVGDRERVLNSIILIYRHDMSSGLH